MKFYTYCLYLLLLFFCIINVESSYAQRVYADSQNAGAAGLLCLGCVVTNPANAADGNLQTYSTLNVTVGLAAQTYQSIIFPTSVAAGTPVTVKLGTGNTLLSLQALGAVFLQAYNGNTPIGQPVAAGTLLTALSNNNQVEVSITPAQQYDRIRLTLNGGVTGALSNIYLYEGFYTGNGPVPCNTAIDELHGISAGLLNLGADVGGVVNPQNAIDGNLNTASTLNAGVGAVGAYAQQTVIFSTTSVLGDSVRLTLSIPQALIEAGVLSNISVSTFTDNNSNNDTHTLSSSLLTVRLLDLSGNNRKVTVTFAPSKIFNQVELTLGGGIANALSTLNFYEAQRIIPAPVINYNNAVATNVQICSGNSATLTAVAVPNTTFNWYTAATGGTPVFTGSTFTTPALTATTTYYVEAMRAGCTDASARTPVTVTVNPVPAAPLIANNNVTVCSGQAATFTATPVAGITVNWYTAATGGTLVYTGNTYTTGALTQTTNFYAEAVSGGQCVSASRTLVTATVTPLPAAPTLTATNTTICDSTVAVLFVSNPQTGIQYQWYAAATGGNALYTGATFTTPVLTANTSYYVEADNANACASTPRVQANVIVVPKPANPVLTAGATTVNAGQATSITVTNAQTGNTYNWYTSANASASIYTGTTFQTPALYTATTYYVEAVNSTGCKSESRTPVTISVTVTAAPCSIASQQISNVNGLCVGCGVINNNLAVDGDTTTASTINVTAGLTGAYAEQALIFQQPGYAGDTVKVVLQSPVGLANAALLGQTEVTLYNGTVQVARYPLNNALIKVSLIGGGTNRYAVYIPATGNYDRVTVRLSSGAATALTSLNVYYAMQEFPKPVFNPAAPEICKGSTAQINITSPANGTFGFYTSPTGGTPVFTGTNFTTPVLTSNTTYYIVYTRNGCSGSVRFPVSILVDDVPAAPVASANNVTVNSGQTATLTATAGNAVIKWYSAATGGTALYTGSTFTTPALTANTTYYAEAASGSCVSPTRTPVTVTVNEVVIPNVTVTPPAQAIDPGQTATFTASSTTPGAVFNWYSTPTGGTSIFTGPVFTTPAEYAGTTYYAEASVPATGAVSATRATATVTINAQAVSPVPCDAATDQTTAINALVCVGCSVNNAEGSVDNDRNTFSQLNVPVGLVNAYAAQTLRFANTGSAGDSVIVELGVPGTLASAGVLSSISIATYNGTTYNNDRFNVNGSLVSISLLNGVSRFRVAFAAQSSFDRVEIRLNSALAGVLNSLNIYDASEEVPSPIVTTSNITACQGSQATLTATASNDATIKWYTTATGGTAVFTGPAFTTPVLNTTTTYYAEAGRTADGCTQAVRKPATVTVTPVPAAPVVANASVTVCSGQPATFTAQAVTGVTYNWYSAATGGTPIFTGNPFTTPALNASTNYYAEATGSGQCTSATRTQVTANVTATPATPMVAQTPVQDCSGSSVTLTATSAQAGATFNWYTTPTGGTPVFTGAQFITPALTANTSYYVEAANGSCVSAARAEDDVVVNPAPAAPTVTVTPAGGQISSGQTAQLSAASTTPGVTFNWYTAATGGTPIFTGAAFTTPVLTSNTTYYVEAVNPATGCVSTLRTPVTITVNPVFSTSCDFASTQTNNVNGGLACAGCSIINPDYAVDADTTNFSQLNLPVSVAGSYVAQQLIFGDTGNAGDTVSVKLSVPASFLTAGVAGQIQIASYNGATYNGDRIFLNSILLRVQLLSGGQTILVRFAPKSTFDRIEVRLNSGLASLSSVDVYYASKQVAAPNLTVTTENICAGSKAVFTISNPAADVTYKWYASATGGTPLFTGTTFTTPALTATTTYYAESSRTSNGCANPNRVTATANVTPLPVTPVLAQNSVQICAGSTVTLSVTNASSSTVNWYNALTGGTLVFTGASFQVMPIATTSYYAETTNGSCVSASRTQATVTVNPLPAMPGLQSSNVQVCSGSSVSLQVLNPETGVNYDWFTVATGGTVVFTGATFNTPALTKSTAYYVQATNATTGCVNNGGRTQANVNVSDAVGAPVLSAAQTQVCNGGSVTLSVVNPVNGLQYNWYTAATGGTPVFTGTTFTIANLMANIAYYAEAVNTQGCTSTARTETDITVLPVPNAPVVQATTGGLSVCSGTSASLSIVNPQAGVVYRWYDAAAGGTLLNTGTQYNTPALTAGTTYYVEAAVSGNCNPSARTPVTITVNPLPADPTPAKAMVTVCTGSTASLSVASPQAGVIYNWYDSAARTNLLFTGTTYVTGPVSTNTTFYVGAVNASGCQSANVATVQVTVQDAPAAPVIANGATVQSCSGSSVTLNIASPTSGYTYTWYDAATGGNLVFTGTTFNTPALTANAMYYVAVANSTGCVSSARTAVAINVNPLPSAPTITAQGGSANPSVCQGSSTTLTATSTTPDVTFNWYTQATGGTPVFTGANFTTPLITANTTYYAEAVSNTGGCVSADRTPINVLVVAPPATPVPADATVNICSGDMATLSVASPQAGVTYTWYSSTAKTNLLFTGVTFATPALTATTTYYIEAGNGSCNSSSLASVRVVVNSLPSAPAIVNSSFTACSGSQVTLNIANTLQGFTYNWYNTASGGTPVYTGGTFVTPVINTGTVYYAEAVNPGGCASSARTPATITALPAPVNPMVNSTGTTICAGNSTTLTVTNNDPSVTIKWYADATGGTALFTGNSFTTPVLTTAATFYAEAQNSGGCTSATRTAATVVVLQPLAAPSVTVTATTETSVTFSWTEVSGAAGYQVSLDNGLTFTPTGSNDLSYTVNGLKAAQSVALIVKATGATDCQQGANSAAVTGTSTDPLASQVFVPNAFTPNGDGRNDVFLVYGNAIQSVIMSVYNQWGELIFRSENQSKGWDGTYKGTNQPVGVYVYYVDVTLNGGQRITKKGTIDLLR